MSSNFPNFKRFVVNEISYDGHQTINSRKNRVISKSYESLTFSCDLKSL